MTIDDPAKDGEAENGGAVGKSAPLFTCSNPTPQKQKAPNGNSALEVDGDDPDDDGEDDDDSNESSNMSNASNSIPEDPE